MRKESAAGKAVWLAPRRSPILHLRPDSRVRPSVGWYVALSDSAHQVLNDSAVAASGEAVYLEETVTLQVGCRYVKAGSKAVYRFCSTSPVTGSVRLTRVPRMAVILNS